VIRLIADDHEIVRQGVQKVLISDFNTDHIIEAIDGKEAVKYAQDFHPDIILMDIPVDTVVRPVMRLTPLGMPAGHCDHAQLSPASSVLTVL